MYQIELVGGPLDGNSLIIEDPYPARVMFPIQPEISFEACQHSPDDVVTYQHAVYKKRPRKGLAVFYDFDGIH